MTLHKIEVPEFRLKAIEDQFILKMTKVCDIMRDFGDLKERPYDIRHMLEILKIHNWKNIPPFKFVLDPLEKAFNEVDEELRRMRTAGHLRSRYVLEKNEELAKRIRTMVEADIEAQWLVGDLLKQDQYKFLYEVQKVIYDSGLKNFFINEQKREKTMQTVVPKLCTLMTMGNIKKIDDKKEGDKAKAVVKEERKAKMMAETGMSFDPVVEEPVVQEEVKKKDTKKEKKKKEVEIDPEVLEQQRLAELKKKDIEQYGVSNTFYIPY